MFNFFLICLSETFLEAIEILAVNMNYLVSIFPSAYKLLCNINNTHVTGHVLMLADPVSHKGMKKMGLWLLNRNIKEPVANPMKTEPVYDGILS